MTIDKAVNLMCQFCFGLLENLEMFKCRYRSK